MTQRALCVISPFSLRLCVFLPSSPAELLQSDLERRLVELERHPLAHAGHLGLVPLLGETDAEELTVEPLDDLARLLGLEELLGDIVERLVVLRLLRLFVLL